MARRKAAANRTRAESSALDLGNELTIRTVGEAREQLRKRLDRGSGPVRVSGAGLERVDTAGLQLLCAFANALTAGDRSLEWQAPSPALLAAAAALGLSPALALPAPA